MGKSLNYETIGCGDTPPKAAQTAFCVTEPLSVRKSLNYETIGCGDTPPKAAQTAFCITEPLSVGKTLNYETIGCGDTPPCRRAAWSVNMKLRLTVDIDEINYAQMIRAILPYVKKEDIPLPETVLNAAASPGVLENFLKFIPKDKQDELVLKLIEKNKVRMIARARKLADKAGVDAVISDISLRERRDEYVVY
ncbi:MAG: hypothetical protein NC120_06525 [Ruminococcus sp.]|nr:hypothetical protein [Ruminococcus sp.]